MIRGPQVWPESFNKWGDEVSANVGGSGADFGNGTDCDRSPLFRATTPLLRVVVHLRDTCWTQVIDTTHTHTHTKRDRKEAEEEEEEVVEEEESEREREREKGKKSTWPFYRFFSSVHCCHSDMVFFRSWATKGKKTLAHAGINNERAFCVNVKNSTDPPLFFSNFLPFLSLSLSLSLAFLISLLLFYFFFILRCILIFFFFPLQ